MIYFIILHYYYTPIHITMIYFIILPYNYTPIYVTIYYYHYYKF
jgi:hypothetical protein